MGSFAPHRSTPSTTTEVTITSTYNRPEGDIDVTVTWADGVTDRFATEPTKPLTAREWLEMGVTMGWCSAPVCATHDGVPYTDDEAELLEDGWDPCCPAVRLW